MLLLFSALAARKQSSTAPWSMSVATTYAPARAAMALNAPVLAPRSTTRPGLTSSTTEPTKRFFSSIASSE